jgi:hypothetical protein
MAGVQLPAGWKFDGIDLVSRLAKRQPEMARTLFWRGRRAESTWKAVREGNLKYVVHTQRGAKVLEGLFDLAADSGEKTDLLATRAADGARLRERLAGWEKEVAPVR